MEVNAVQRKLMEDFDTSRVLLSIDLFGKASVRILVRGKSQSMMGSGMLIFQMFLFVCLGVCFPLFGRAIGDGLLNLTWVLRRGGVGERKLVGFRTLCYFY